MSNTSLNNGLISIQSKHDFQTTVSKLETVLIEKGMNIFATVNHTAGAEKVGQTIPPTLVTIFGNPQSGTPLIQSQHSIAIDLPQKMLVRQNENGQVWLSYNAPDYLAQRHNIDDCQPLLEKIADMLDNITKEVCN